MRSRASRHCSRRAILRVYLISDTCLHVCRLPVVVVRPASAPAKSMLGRQHIADENQVKSHNLGPMHYKCRCCLHFNEYHVGKAKFGEATFSQCCKRGKEVLPALKPTPPVLKSLICKQRPGFLAFLKNIRSYSCAFQMASSGEIFLHTCSSYQHICMQVCIGEQESSHSIMGSCDFFGVVHHADVYLAANVINMCRYQRQKQGTASDRRHNFWGSRQCTSLHRPRITSSR